MLIKDMNLNDYITLEKLEYILTVGRRSVEENYDVKLDDDAKVVRVDETEIGYDVYFENGKDEYHYIGKVPNDKFVLVKRFCGTTSEVSRHLERVPVDVYDYFIVPAHKVDEESDDIQYVGDTEEEVDKYYEDISAFGALDPWNRL